MTTNPIEPGLLYTPESAAECLGVSADWITENLIDTGEIWFTRKDDLVVFLGHWLIRWVEENVTANEEDD